MGGYVQPMGGGGRGGGRFNPGLPQRRMSLMNEGGSGGGGSYADPYGEGLSAPPGYGLDAGGMAPMSGGGSGGPPPDAVGGGFNGGAYRPAQAPGPIRGSTPYRPANGLSSMENWSNEQDRAAGGADVLDQGIRDFYNQAQEQAARYGGQADEYFAQLMQNAGYSPQEAQQIMRESETNGLKMGDEEFNSRFQTEGERGEIRGNPYGARDSFARDSGTTRDTFYDNNNKVSQTVNAAADDVLGSTNAYRKSLGDTANRYNGAVDQANFDVDPAYSGRVSSLDSEAGRDLSLSDRYMEKRGWSEGDLDKVSGRAARQVGGAYASEVDAINRQAAASGNTNPMALAAARLRAARSGAVDQGDAIANAEAAGLNTAKLAEQDIEGTRLGAAGQRIQTRAGLASDVEDRRFRGEEAGMGARFHAADATTAAERAANDAGFAGARYTGDLRTGAAERTREAATGLDERTAKTQADYERAGEQAASDRGTHLADTRATIAANTGQERFSRGAYANDASSGRARTVADARRADETAGRGYYAGQAGDWANRGQTALGQRTSAYSAGTAATQGAARGYGNAYEAKQQRPGTFGKILGAATGILGGLNPTGTLGRVAGAAAGGARGMGRGY